MKKGPNIWPEAQPIQIRDLANKVLSKDKEIIFSKENVYKNSTASMNHNRIISLCNKLVIVALWTKGNVYISTYTKQLEQICL